MRFTKALQHSNTTEIGGGEKGGIVGQRGGELTSES